MRYYIADTHFGHKNVIEYCGRPYESVEHMDISLIENWNSVVTDEDEVYILGDFTWGNRERLEDYASKLNGKKYLVPGNHDRVNRFNGSDIEVLSYKTITAVFNGETYMLRHCPPDPRETDKVIFGHIHEKGCGDARCVSVENINYTPISHDELEKKLAE